jgi:hypothetical protein
MTGRTGNSSDNPAAANSWTGVTWDDWKDYATIRRHLDQGADPDHYGGGRPLHRAAVFGSPEVVAELARRVTDVDAVEDDYYATTALWEAVMSRKPENARALVAAGADPWRPVIGGWSAGRLSLAGPTPDLFPRPAGEPGLTEREQAAAEEATRLLTALGDLYYDGTGLACVAGIDADEAIRRLEATPAEEANLDPDWDLDDILANPYDYDLDETHHIVGVSTVPGGCVLTQPWGYAPSMPGIHKRLSAGTYSYGLYANPKSGNQGSITRDGVIEGWDLHPGGAAPADATSDEVLASYLYAHNAVAYACAYAGLRLTDARAVTGPPERWVVLPERDYWEH